VLTLTHTISPRRICTRSNSRPSVSGTTQQMCTFTDLSRIKQTESWSSSQAQRRRWGQVPVRRKENFGLGPQTH
jgi:hypothetical protein